MIVENYDIELSQEELPLLSELKDYLNRHISCFDVPGHVKNKGVKVLNKLSGDSIMKMDRSLSPYMDNVSKPTRIIKNINNY